MTGKHKRAAIYARVSTRNGQTPENQLAELRQVAERAGWRVVGEYVDHGISGAKGRDQRPEFDRLCRDATRRGFDVAMAWSVDRVGRSLSDLIDFLKHLHGLGVDLYLHRQGVDTTTPGGKALFQMMGVFAEFERELIRERIAAGLDRAKAEIEATGSYQTKANRTITRLGRPRIGADKQRAILAARREGKGTRTIAKEVGCARETVSRVLREHASGDRCGPGSALSAVSIGDGTPI